MASSLQRRISCRLPVGNRQRCTAKLAEVSCFNGFMIRKAHVDDIGGLPDIERAAGAAFRDVGMTAIADDPPLPEERLLGYQEAGRAWVASDVLDRPVAYLLLDTVDGSAYIEQVSVHPKYARQGLGRALIDTAEAWARQYGLLTLTLTTFADVPWNAPYYARLGFNVRVCCTDR